MEESGTYLESDGKDEEYETEILDKGKCGGVGPESEMTEDYTSEQNPCRPYRHSFYLEFSEEKPDCDDDGEKKYGMCYSSSCE